MLLLHIVTELPLLEFVPSLSTIIVKRGNLTSA